MQWTSFAYFLHYKKKVHASTSLSTYLSPTAFRYLEGRVQQNDSGRSLAHYFRLILEKVSNV